MSIEEGLKSSDLSTIKSARGTAKGQVTRYINDLKNYLKRDQDGNLVTAKVSKDMVLGFMTKIETNYDSCLNLHQKFRDLRPKKPDEAAEADAKAEDDMYENTVRANFTSITEVYDEYLRKLESDGRLIELKEKLTELSDEMEVLKVQYEIHYDVADQMVKNPEEDKNMARSVKDNVQNSMNKYVDKIREYKSARAHSIDFELKYSPAEDYTKIMKDTIMVVNSLERIAINHDAKSSSSTSPIPVSVDRNNTVKLQKLSCPKFSGIPRDFANFKRDFNELVNVPGRPDVEIGINLRESIPQKHLHLINHLETTKHKEMMSILEKKFGSKSLVVRDIISQIEKLKPISTDKGFIEFVEQLEKVKLDLETLGQISEIANAGYIGKIEDKLPQLISIDWWKIVVDEELEQELSSVRYDRLMKFLRKAKERVEGYSSSVARSSAGGGNKNILQYNCVSGATTLSAKQSFDRTKSKDGIWKPCLACNVDGATDLNSIQHPMDTCEVWNSLSFNEKQKRVKCIKHPFKDDHITSNCTVKGRKCKNCSQDGHHFLLCPKKTIKSTSNSTTLTIQGENKMMPVMLQTQYVLTPDNSTVGALLDLASTDDYVTHSYAKKKKLLGEDVDLIVEGIGGEENCYKTKLYMVPIKIGEDKFEVPCYGMDKITSVLAPPGSKSYKQLCEKFNLSPAKVRRPNSIDLLLSMRQNFLHPKPVKQIGSMVLYSGPLGMVFGGSDSSLEFQTPVKCYPLSVHEAAISSPSHARTMKVIVKEASFTATAKTDREFLDFFKEESIGVECQPRCGGCRCGKCPTGSKAMTIKEEKDYKKFQSLMSLDPLGTESDPGPYWVSELPWTVDKSKLANNRSAVLGVMKSTVGKLSKDPSWEKTYNEQLRNLIDRNFAREVSEEELANWIAGGGSTYYISHQLVVQPLSSSTPIRVVFNSSQRFKGHSLNTSWELGPDVMNNLHGVLLRFRNDYVGAQGDVKKMFYMVRIPQSEQMMQLFLWKFPEEDRLKTYCMNRLVMGNKPSSNLSIIAMHQTANLEDNARKFPAAFQAIMKDGYVDNIFTVGSSLEEVKESICQIETVAAMGGFYFKDWIISGQNYDEKIIGAEVTSSDCVEERALGVAWDVKNDLLFVKSNLDKGSKKRKKDSYSIVLPESDIDRISIKPHLTLRICLSIHAKAYDPHGWILPVRMIGNLLFRETLQTLKMNKKGKIPWDDPIDFELQSVKNGQNLKDSWNKYFEMLLEVEKIKFRRCVKPENADPTIDPDLITFCDGNPEAFGVVGYVLFTLIDGTRSASLLMSKAKLGPLSHKGETSRNELSGATLSARLKVWILQECGFKIKSHFHFTDSMIVYAMLKKESYGFNTFAALRVGEIQEKCDYEDWAHIPSKENAADVLTKGQTPGKLLENGVWQNGPGWLTLDRSFWPVTKVENLISYSDQIEDEISDFMPKMSKTAISSSLVSSTYLSGVKKRQISFRSNMDDFGLDALISRCGNIEKLVRSVAYFLRLAGRALRKHPEVSFGKEIGASEYNDAYNFIIAWEQKKRLDDRSISRLVPVSIEIKLHNYEISVTHIIIGGRVKNFPVGYSASSNLPILPYGVLSNLIVLHYHDRYHCEADTVVAHVRHDVWPIKARKIASSIDSRCRICKEKRMKLASQMMGELPDFRSQIQPSFSVVLMDLFGPMEIRDDCVKKGPRVFKKVWGVVFTCAFSRAVHLEVAIDYSTEAVLHCVRRLMALRGDVRKIISDPGTQLVGASREMSEWRKGWSIDQLTRFGASKGLEWVTVMANSHHQAGAVEIMVKLVKGVKKALLKVVGDTKLSLNEMFTLLLEVANIVNERPIGIKPNSLSPTDYLSPNSLLLGRCSDRISAGPFGSDQMLTDCPQAARSRFLLVQAITKQFSQVWLNNYFPTLLVRQKWHADRRNLSKGDICLLKDSNALRGEWRMCEVVKPLPDRSKKVRNVEVLVKPKQGGSGEYISSKPIIIRRHVSNLIVLVPTEDRPELSLGKCEDTTGFDNCERNENAVQDRSEYYDENIFKSR